MANNNTFRSPEDLAYAINLFCTHPFENMDILCGVYCEYFPRRREITLKLPTPASYSGLVRFLNLCDIDCGAHTGTFPPSNTCQHVKLIQGNYDYNSFRPMVENLLNSTLSLSIPGLPPAVNSDPRLGMIVVLFWENADNVAFRIEDPIFTFHPTRTAQLLNRFFESAGLRVTFENDRYRIQRAVDDGILFKIQWPPNDQDPQLIGPRLGFEENVGFVREIIGEPRNFKSRATTVSLPPAFGTFNAQHSKRIIFSTQPRIQPGRPLAVKNIPVVESTTEGVWIEIGLLPLQVPIFAIDRDDQVVFGETVKDLDERTFIKVANNSLTEDDSLSVIPLIGGSINFYFPKRPCGEYSAWLKSLDSSVAQTRGRLKGMRIH